MATDVVGSKMPAENKYGQNGYCGASSDLPGEKTTSGFLPPCEVPAANTQTRDVGKSSVQPGFGMKRQTDSSVIE